MDLCPDQLYGPGPWRDWHQLLVHRVNAQREDFKGRSPQQSIPLGAKHHRALTLHAFNAQRCNTHIKLFFGLSLPIQTLAAIPVRLPNIPISRRGALCGRPPYQANTGTISTRSACLPLPTTLIVMVKVPTDTPVAKPFGLSVSARQIV